MELLTLKVDFKAMYPDTKCPQQYNQAIAEAQYLMKTAML